MMEIRKEKKQKSTFVPGMKKLYLKEYIIKEKKNDMVKEAPANYICSQFICYAS